MIQNKSGDPSERNQQLAIVHGNIKNCDGSRFPSIFVRLSEPDVYDWITKKTTGTCSYSRVH